MAPRNTRSIALAATLALSSTALAQVVDPAYSAAYSLRDLGAVPGVPGPYGGITFLAGSNDTLLIGGNANQAGGAIYSIGLQRDGNGNITGFNGTASLHATAPGIDGGLSYAPNGVLFYTSYSGNLLGQIKPGSVAPDLITDLTPLGVPSSVGSHVFVPAGQPGAGDLKVISYNAGTFQNLPYSLNGNGLFDFGTPGAAVTIGGGPEGVAYVPLGSPLFPSPALLVSEYALGSVAAYDVDAAGTPVIGSRRLFVSGLSGAEGALIDPITGDFMFSTFGGGNQLVIVGGFAPVPEPGEVALIAGIGLAGFGLWRRIRKN